MALIGTLRTKATTLIIAAVALAIVAFILNDLFGSGPRALFGGQDNSVGEIAGDRISLEEWQSTMMEMENSYIGRMGRQPGERDMISLREQAWTLLIARHAISPQYDKVGSKVTAEEVYDMVQGRNINESIKTSFMDSTGAFDRSRLIQYLQTVDKMPDNSPDKIQWKLFRSQLRGSRERIKYENLLVKSVYVTKAEAEKQYHIDNDVVEIKYLFVPYAAADSTVKPSDADISKYYGEHKPQYKTEGSRSLKYVTFPLTPSAKDTADLRTEMEKIAADFHTTDNDSTFASLNTEGDIPYTEYNNISLPLYISKETAVKGLVLGPFLDNGVFKVVKISDIGKSETYQMKASHILIKWTDETPEAKKVAKAKAAKILAEIKAGASFAAKAIEFSEDGGSKTRGGDLGWFPSGQMVAPFEKPIMAATKTGVLNEIVETSFGYHLIDVTGVKDNSSFKVATIEKALTPSNETVNAVYRQADAFANNLGSLEDFDSKAKSEKLSVFEANNLTSNQQYVNNLGEARSLVLWLYREAKVGKPSGVISLDNDYVVAVMTAEVEPGTRPLDKALKDEISVQVLKELQGKNIIAKLSGEGSLEDLAKAFPTEATVGTANDLKLTATNIATIGYDALAIGKAFSVENGKRTKPFSGENGVVIIEVQNKTVAPGIEDYTIFKNQLQQTAEGRGGLEIADALKDRADIVDKRYKVY